MASDRVDGNGQSEEGWYQEAYQALSSFVHQEATNSSQISVPQATEKPKVRQNSNKSIQVHETGQSSDDAGHLTESQQPNDAKDLPDDSSDFDQDDSVNLLECEYCDASLLPEDSSDQPLEYCNTCGMPSGIPILTKEFQDGPESDGR